MTDTQIWQTNLSDAARIMAVVSAQWDKAMGGGE